MRRKNEIPSYKFVDKLLYKCLRYLPPTELAEQIALWWGYKFRPAPSIVRLRSGASMQITHTDYLQLLIYYLGTFEPYCLPYLRKSTPKGGTILDVGANIGFYTMESAIVVGPSGQVIAIEAANSHAKAIRRNIEINEFRNIRVFETAVGAARGKATLQRASSDNLGMYSLGATKGVDQQVVSVRTIDDLLDECCLSSLDLIKMDIEGSEYGALVGASATLNRFRPTLLIEINDLALRSCGSSGSELMKLLREWSYSGWQIGRTSTRFIRERDTMNSCVECIFVHDQNESMRRRLGLVAPRLTEFRLRGN
jgi:FkbM family methyltransferase